MDISNSTQEQKVSAAVAYLSKNIEKAPESTRETLARLNKVNNDGMEIVKQIQAAKAQIEQLETMLSEKIGAAKMLFEIVGEQIPADQIDELAKQFEIRQFQVSENAPVDMAGATAKSVPPIAKAVPPVDTKEE